MPTFTLICRVTDKLMLVESMDNDERSADFDQYRRQAKQLFQTMSRTSEQSGLVTTGNFYFLYLIDNDVCYLTFCDQSYPKKLAYSFLEELKKEFDIQHSGEIAGTKRPYAFEKFDTFIQKTKKLYVDTKSQRNLNKITTDLKDIERIMVKNVQDILGRGAKINDVAEKTDRLAARANQYEKNAIRLNQMYWWRTYGPIIGVAGLFILFIIARFLWF